MSTIFADCRAYGSSCFYTPPEEYTWEAGRAVCQSLCGDLAMIKTAEKQQEAREYLDGMWNISVCDGKNQNIWVTKFYGICPYQMAKFLPCGYSLLYCSTEEMPIMDLYSLIVILLHPHVILKTYNTVKICFALDDPWVGTTFFNRSSQRSSAFRP